MAKISKYTKKNGDTAWMFKGHIATDFFTKKKISTTRRGFKTRQETKKALDALTFEVRYGRKNNISKMTFNELYNEWIEHKRTSVRASTVAIYIRYAKNQILPEFGNLKLNDISVSYCQKVVNKWHSEYKTYDQMRKQTAQILSFGESMEYLDRNPMSKTELPRRKVYGRERNYYTKEEVKQILDAFSDFGNIKQYAFFRLLAYTGMRKGEALALQWSDIDLIQNEVKIVKTLAIDEHYKTIIQPPKTKASERTISLDVETITTLKNWRSQQKKDLFKLGYNTGSEEQYIFTSKDNKLYVPNYVNDWLNYVSKKYGLRHFTPHGFRHTHVSLLLENGESIKVVQERLGHEDSKVTMDIYAHVTNNAPKKTGDNFANLMSSIQ